MTERDRWLEKRRQSLGASEVAAILGLSPWESPFTIWARKTGEWIDDGEETEWQRWGQIIEPAICDEYSAQTGRKVIDHGRYAVRYSETCPHLSATLDREIVAFDQRGPGVMEAKNVSAFKAAEWADGVPLIYQVQVQAQLEVTGYRWGSLAALVGGSDFRWMDIERDEPFIEMMRRKVAEFWQLVETRTRPTIDASPSTAEVLRKLYPRDSGETIALSGEAATWTDEIEECDRAIKEIEERKRLARSRLIAEIGDASYGVLPGGGRWSYRSVTRKAHTVDESITRVLRRAK